MLSRSARTFCSVTDIEIIFADCRNLTSATFSSNWEELVIDKIMPGQLTIFKEPLIFLPDEQLFASVKKLHPTFDSRYVRNRTDPFFYQTYSESTFTSNKRPNGEPRLPTFWLLAALRYFFPNAVGL